MKGMIRCMKNLENYNDNEIKYIGIQNKLVKKINMKNEVTEKRLNVIAGVDLAYWKEGAKEYAVCCIVVINYKTYEIVEKKYYSDRINVPYIPGCLAFREIPLFLNAYDLLEHNIDLFFFDGNGYLHPRHMGLATHAGILIDKPTIGIAKSYYKIANTEFKMPEEKRGSYEDILVGGDVYGRVLRTKNKVRPIFISIGNKIDLDTTMKISLNLVGKNSRIPLPTRMADIMSHEIKRNLSV